jgi:S-adenosylmethionine synthetase
MMIATSGAPMGEVWESRSAEDVLPGHPDRLCDAIAEAVVTKAHRHDPQAIVSVEVAAFRRTVRISGQMQLGQPGNCGRMTAPSGFRGADEFEHVVHEQLAASGFVDDWARETTFTTELSVGSMDGDDRTARSYSVDQTISVGHADPEGPDLMPIETWVARRMKDALVALRTEHADALGPDGKVLVDLSVPIGRGPLGVRRRARLERVNLAVQHAKSVGYQELHRWVVPHLEGVLDELVPWVDTTGRLEGERLRINGAGHFVWGGPDGDGGLSGKKLVVDHYGPRVPIGGGAICGKDAHQPDRVGALRARQIAVRLARASGLAATVTLGFLPGLAGADRLGARLSDGTFLDADAIAGRISVPDLSVAGSASDLDLAGPDWSDVMRRGYFGTGQAWEE